MGTTYGVKVRIVLGFHSPSAMKRRCREILDKGGPIGREDLEFMKALFRIYYRGGVDELWIEEHRGQNTFVVRRGKLVRDASFNRAISTAFGFDVRRRKIAKAFRNAIGDQVRSHKYKHQGQHVHHVIPFKTILRNFIKEYKINYDDVRIEDGGRYVGPVLVDEELSREWRWYHRQHAKFAIISPEEHQKLHSEDS